MAVSYNKLWKILIDRKMKKKDLAEKAELSRHTMQCLSKDENVTTEVLARICNALGCGFDDIVEIIPGDEDTIKIKGEEAK